MNEIKNDNNNVNLYENKIKSMIIKIVKIILSIITIIVLIFSPYLLILDWKVYLPFVVTVWIISAAYYMFVKARKDREDNENSK